MIGLSIFRIELNMGQLDGHAASAAQSCLHGVVLHNLERQALLVPVKDVQSPPVSIGQVPGFVNDHLQ